MYVPLYGMNQRVRAIILSSSSSGAMPVSMEVDVSPENAVPGAMKCFIWAFLLQADGDAIHYVPYLAACASFYLKRPSRCHMCKLIYSSDVFHDG